MARQRRNPDDLDFDNTPPSRDEMAQMGDAVVQPKLADPTPKLTDGKAILARLFGIDENDVNALVKVKEEANVFAMASQAQEYAQRMKSQAENEYIKEHTGKSSAERTQEVVEYNWGKEDAPRWRTRLVHNQDIAGKPESITLLIPARSREEAQGRYMTVCGIRSTDHFIVATPVEKPADATLAQGS